MKRIYAIGETVYDIIFKNDQPVSAKAGGAMLNTSVSLGRLELPVSFISEIGEDQVGNYILGFLQNNNVDCSLIYHFPDGQTALAIAFLDEQENASYEFYKRYPQKRLQIDFPEPDKDDIILYGSFFAITSAVREKLMNFVKVAKQNNALILYDPNFRSPHVKDLPVVKDLIIENIGFSSIVRGSDEDFKLIFGSPHADEAFHIVRNFGCNYLVYTQADKTVEFRSDKISFSLDVPKINPLSTIGAGDNFNAGLIWYMFNLGNISAGFNSMTEKQWKDAVQVAISFGSHVCERMDNYISNEFASRLNEIK